MSIAGREAGIWRGLSCSGVGNLRQRRLYSCNVHLSMWIVPLWSSKFLRVGLSERVMGCTAMPV